MPMGIQSPGAVITAEQRMQQGGAVPPVGGTETEFRMVPSPLNDPTPRRAAPAAEPAPGWAFPPLQIAQVGPPPAPIQPQVQPTAPAAQESEIPAEQIIAFVGHLDQVIATGVMTPRQFAEAIVAQLGPGPTQQVIQAISADHFIELTTRHPDGQKSAIVTRNGQKFVRSVWEEAASILASMAA